MSLDEFIDYLYFIPFAPQRTGDKLEYYVGGRMVGTVEAVWMWKNNKSITPFFIDALNGLGISHPDGGRIANAENFQFLPYPNLLDHDRLRIDMEVAMFHKRMK